jgi:protein-S-isoprenylcysteine O-methyltransferase Ste14
MRSPIVRSGVAALVLASLLFIPAGTLGWPQGWAFLGLLMGGSFATGAWLRAKNPALLAEREKSALGGNQAPRDRGIMAAISGLMLVWLGFMPLDARRFHWSHLPLLANLAGGLLILGTFAGWIAVFRANPFAIPSIRLQPERGQTVITTGPYAIVRHPAYTISLLLLAGAPLLLGSLFRLYLAVVFIPLLGARILGEETLLAQGLPGYEAYRARVRHRLVPWLW